MKSLQISNARNLVFITMRNVSSYSSNHSWKKMATHQELDQALSRREIFNLYQALVGLYAVKFSVLSVFR